MAREVNEIITHLRACIADGSISATLIQTEDLAALCDAAEDRSRAASRAESLTITCRDKLRERISFAWMLLFQWPMQGRS